MNEITKQAPSKAAFKRLAECTTLGDAFQTQELRAMIAAAAPKFMDPDAMLRTWIQAAGKSPLIYQADLRQALGAFQSLAYLGLVPNTHLQHAHIIPFKTMRWNKATKKRDIPGVDLQVIVGYQGYIELGSRSGAIEAPHCDVVFNETLEKFSYSYGTNRHLNHAGKPFDFIPTGEPHYAYSYVREKNNGGESFEVMTWADVISVRNRSQAYRTALAAKEKAETEGWKVPLTWSEAPWVRDAPEMGKKSALRRHFKWLPKCPELRAAVAFEDAQDGGRLDFGPVIDGTASPVDGNVPAMEDEGPTGVDAATAFTDRREVATTPTTETKPAKATRKPAVERERVVQNEPPDDDRFGDEPQQQAKSDPPPTKVTPDVTPHDSGFEAMLVDATGDIVGEDPLTDPLAFARAFMMLWREAGRNRDVLREYNADALEDVSRLSVKAAELLSEMEAEEDAGEEDAQGDDGQSAQKMSFVAVEVPTDRGKQSWTGYVKSLKDAMSHLRSDQMHAWAEAQHATLTACPAAQRALAIRAISETCGRLGITQIAWLSGLVRRPAATNDAAPPATEGLSSDERWVNARVAELEAISDRAKFDEIATSTAVRTVMARLRRDNAALFERANAAFTGKNRELTPPAEDQP